MIDIRLNHRDATGRVGVMPAAVFLVLCERAINLSRSPETQSGCMLTSFMVAMDDCARQVGHS